MTKRAFFDDCDTRIPVFIINFMRIDRIMNAFMIDHFYSSKKIRDNIVISYSDKVDAS